MTGWRSGTVDVADGQLAYHRTGGALRPLVLSHGLTDNGLCWSRFATALAADFDVIMLDARGHGESSRIDVARPHDPGRDIAQAVEVLGLVAPVLMGHSLGALATAACAAAFPGMAAKIVLEDPPFMDPSDPAEVETRRRRFRRQVETLGAMTDEEITATGKALSPTWADAEFPTWTQAKRQVDPEAMVFPSAPWRETVAALAVPTLLILGQTELGGMLTPAVAAEAVALNPRIQTVSIAGAGHNIRRENFDDTLAAVRGFLL